MCGMGNLTRAAYANQRMTLDRNFAKESSKRNTMIALRGAIHSGVFSSFMFTQGVWRCLYQTWVFGNTPLFSVPREVCFIVKAQRKKEVWQEENCGWLLIRA